MFNARSDRDTIGLLKKRPFKVIISFITLMAFLFNTVSYEIALLRPLGFTGQAWADITPKEDIFKELNVKTFSLPQNLGTIKDAWSSSNSQIIIHIQDAHCNYYAQHAISNIIEYLNKEYGINEINLEGGAKDYDISIFTGIKDKAKRDKAADYFVKEGLVNGAEYFAINNPERVTLWGIEDVKLYIDNLKVYRNSLKYKDEVDRYLKNLSYILSNLKLKVYSKELLEFDSKYNAYKAGSIDFKDYLVYLMQRSKERLIDIKAYTSIYLLGQTLGQEAAIDFRKANNERDELIDGLGKKLSKRSLEELVSKTVEFRSGRISQADFYQYLINKAKSVNMKLDNLTELKKYYVYLVTYQAIDKSRIMNEVQSLEDKFKSRLFTNDKDRELDTLSKNFALMKNVFNVSLTLDDYRYYKANERSFEMRNYKKFIERESPLYNIQAKLDDNIMKLDDYREYISKFYEYSFKRDTAFMKNVKFLADSRQLKAESKKAAILVTGGFHTENLAELFKKQGISYVSIIPNFKNSDGYECPYFNILSGADKTQLVKAVPAMLAGNMATASQLNPTLRDAVEEFGGAPVALPPSAAGAILRQQNVKHSDIIPFLKSLNMPDVTVINFDTHPDDGLADEEAAPGNWVRAAKERRLIGDVYWVLPEQENAAKLYGMTPEELRKKRHDAAITYATSDINDRRLADIKGPIVVSIDFDYLSFTGFKRLAFKIGFLRRIAIRKEIDRIFAYLTQNNIQVAGLFFAESGPEYVPESDKVFIDRELNSAYRRYIDKVEVSASAAARVQNPRHEVPSGPGPSAAKDSDGTNLIPKETIEKWLDERNIEIPQPGTMAHSLMGQVAIKESTAQTLSDISTQSNDEAMQSNVAALFMPTEKRFTPVGRDRNTLIEEALNNLKIKPSEVTGILLEGGRVEIRPLGKGEFRYVNHVIIKTAQKEYHFTSSTNYRSDDLSGHLRIAEEYSYLKLIRDKYKYIERFQEPLAIGMFDYKGIKRRVILKEFKPGMDMKQFLTARLSGQMNDNDIANFADVMYDWGRCLADVYNATGGYITDPHPKNFVVNDAVIPPVISIIDAEDFRDGLPDSRIFDVVSQQLAHIERSISENPLRRQILLMHPTIEKVLSKTYLSGFISNYITNHDLDVEKFLNSMDETAPQVGLLIGDILSKDSAMRENSHIKNLSVLSTIFTAKPAELPSLRHKNISNVDLSLPKSRFGVSGVNIAHVLISALNEELKITDPANAPIVSVIGSLSYALTVTEDIDWDAIRDFDIRVHTDKPLSGDTMQRITTLFYNKLRDLGVNIQTPGVEEQDAFVKGALMQKWGISESSGDKVYRTQILFVNEKNLFEGETGYDSYLPTDLFFGSTERLNTILNKVGLDAIVTRTEMFYKNMLKDAQREYRDANWPDEEKIKLLKQFYQLAYLRGEKLFWLLNAYKELSNKYDERLFVKSCEEAIDKLLRIGDDQLREELSKNIQNLSIIAAVAPAPTKPLESAGIGEVGPAPTKPLESAGIGEVGPARLPVLRSSESEVPGGSGLSAEKTDDVERIVNTCILKIRDRLLNKIDRSYRAFKDIDIAAMSKEELEDARAKFEICPITTKIAHVLLCKTLARMPRFEMSMWAAPFDLSTGRGQNSMHFWNEIRDTVTGRRFYVSFADGQFEDKWIARGRVVDITDEVKRNGLLESMQILPHKATTIGIGEINNVLGVDGAQAIAALAAREVPSAAIGSTIEKSTDYIDIPLKGAHQSTITINKLIWDSMTTEERNLFTEIITHEASDRQTLESIIKRSNGKVLISRHEDISSSDDGRTIYLRLETPVNINGQLVRILQCKGVRPRVGPDGEAIPFAGAGRPRFSMSIEESRILMKPGLPADKPAGGMGWAEAEREFAMTEELTNLRIPCDIAVGLGRYPGIMFHRGKAGETALGYLIVGLEDEDMRLGLDAAGERLIVHSLTGAKDLNIQVPEEDIYSQLGRIYRQLHDAGVTHYFPHLGNIAVVKTNKGLEIRLKDFEYMQHMGEQAALKQRAALRFPDIERLLYDANDFIKEEIYDGEKEYVQNTRPIEVFLKAYFHDLDNATFDQVMHSASSAIFVETVDRLFVKGSVSSYDLTQDKEPFGSIMKALNVVEENRKRNKLSESAVSKTLTPSAVIEAAQAAPQAIEERREALIAAANATDGRDKIVKIIVGRPEGDEFESPFQSTSRKISQMLAKNGYGLVESSMDKGGSQRCDESQVYYYTIFRDDPDGKRTMSSIDSSVKDAQSDMKRDGVAGRIILFASEMEEERGPKVFNAARSAYAKEAMVVPDAYTDMSAKDILYEGAQSYPDIVARVILGRAIAFYYDGGNKEETVKLIKLLLEKITAADAESILVVKDELLEFLKPIRIRPVDYRNITDWRDAQEALAQSA